MNNFFFRYIIFWEKFCREHFTYLAAPYRAAAAPKGAPTHWNSTEAVGSGREKIFPTNYENIYFQIYDFWRKKFHGNSTYLAAPYRAAAAPKGAPTHWKSTEAAGGGGKKFSDKLWKIYFQIYYFWRKNSRKFHLPSCSLSFGSCSQRCCNRLKIHWRCW